MSVSLTVDEVGRIVLPKPVREALGISGGGRLVFAGAVPAGWDSGAAVQKMRTQRLKRWSGLPR